MVSMETTKVLPRGRSELEDHLGYWLRRVSNAVSGEFARALQAKQTSIAEWVLLRLVSEREQVTPGELAETVGLTRGAVSKVVAKLEAKMWLQARIAEGDSRVRLLSITREGRRILPILAKVADENDARFFNCLDANERHSLQKLLSKLADRHDIHDVPTE
jgi:DNA-binding MarR family transcriptional regulator